MIYLNRGHLHHLLSFLFGSFVTKALICFNVDFAAIYHCVGSHSSKGLFLFFFVLHLLSFAHQSLDVCLLVEVFVD